MKPRIDGSSDRTVARLVRRCLKQGSTVEIERLGVFRPRTGGGYEFLPHTAAKVFIAYVEEDYARARRLFEHLRISGLSPWLDRLSLLPGQNWPRAIERATETSDFFLACLSPQSISKRGTFQSELRWALDCARRVPLDDIYFVPVRFAECRVPRRIQQQTQYVDLFPSFRRGAARLTTMLRREYLRRQR